MGNWLLSLMIVFHSTIQNTTKRFPLFECYWKILSLILV